MQYQLITDMVALEKYLSRVDYSLPIVADTESTGLEINAQLLGISLYQPSLQMPAFIAVQTPFFQGEGIPLIELRAYLDGIFRKLRVIAHNSKYDAGVFEMAGFSKINIYFDTQIAVHLADADRKKQLESVVYEDFGYAKKTFKEITGFKWDKITWDENTYKLFTLKTLAEYASEDAYWTWRIYEKYAPVMDKLQVLDVLNKIEIPLAHVLKNMKLRGVRIDKKPLEVMEQQASENIKRLEKEIYKAAGAVFNINSSKQIASIVYDKMGFKPPYTTKGGAPSTDSDALEILAKQGCGVAEKLVEYSALTTLYTNFITAIPRLLYDDGRLRCDFNSWGARTGRFSSSNPNLQNQPNNDEYPVRSAFVPAKGYKFCVLDWSQIELRIAAHLSQDEKLLQAFRDGRDIHQEVADRLGITRKAAKSVNFGILYGLGPQSLAAQIGCTEAEAKKILNDYYETYTGIKHWKEMVERKAVINGYVRNIFGRVRPLRGTKSQDKKQYYGALRRAVNTMVQGTSADLMKLAMVRIADFFESNNLDAHILLTVHDELVVECNEKYVNEVFWQLKHMMEHVVELSVPIEADGKIVDNWSQMKDDDYKGQQYEIVLQDVDFSTLNDAEVLMQHDFVKRLDLPVAVIKNENYIESYLYNLLFT